MARPAESVPASVVGAVVFVLRPSSTRRRGGWYYTQQDAPKSLLGITYKDHGWKQTLLVERVDPGSPAAGAGLESGDLIVAVNGQPLTDPNPFFYVVTRGRPGDHVRLTVARRGGAPAVLDAALAQRPAAERPGQPSELAPQPAAPVPVALRAGGACALVLRVHDADAWLLALSFASLASGATDVIERTVSPSLRNVTLAVSPPFSGMGPAFFYALLARFSARSPLDGRLPWVRPALLAFASVIFLSTGHHGAGQRQRVAGRPCHDGAGDPLARRRRGRVQLRGDRPGRGHRPESAARRSRPERGGRHGWRHGASRSGSCRSCF